MSALPSRGRADRPSRHVLASSAALLCLAAAAALRLIDLDQYPTPLHQDELSDIYDGYSLATTGADRTGERWPILVRGMGPGDYHPGLYAWLAAVSTSIGGFSVWWGRLPAALAGIATVWLVHLAGRRLLGDGGGLLVLACVAFSPIHIQYSRQAHQGACLVPFFAILTAYLGIRALDQVRASRAIVAWRPIAVCGLSIGFSTNAYAGQRLTALLFAVTVIACLVLGTPAGSCRRRRIVYGSATLMATISLGAAPQIYAALTEPDRFFARGATTFFPLSYGPRWWIETLTRNLVANLDPKYLFLSFGEYHILSIARLSAITLPFFYVGVAASAGLVLFRRRWDVALMLGAIACSLLPGIASEGQPSPMRTSGAWALYPIVIALGALTLHARVIQTWSRFRRPANLDAAGSTPAAANSGPKPRRDVGAHLRGSAGWIALMMLAIGVNGGWDVVRYLRSPQRYDRAAQPHFRVLGEWIGAHAAGYDRIYVSADGLFGDLYLAAFSDMNPSEYRAAAREGSISRYGWEKNTRLGRFHLESFDRAVSAWNASAKDERWLVLTAEGPLAEFGSDQHASASPRR